ncbi:MAG: hypothetical protein AAGC60_27210 [Acidobacteriota bacterium]
MRHDLCGLVVGAAAPLSGLRRRSDLAPVDWWLRFEPPPSALRVGPWRPTRRSTLRGDDGMPLLRVDRRRGGHGGDAAWRFRYRDGCRLWLDAAAHRAWATGAARDSLLIYLLGPPLAVTLRRRGLVPLHASGVSLGGRLVLFAGTAGAGKSTAAASCVAAGAEVVGDDVAVLEETPTGAVRVRPGASRLRLWPDAARLLFGADHGLPRLVADWEKHALDAAPARGGDGDADAARPVDVVYLLEGEASDAAIEPLRGHRALVALAAATHGGPLVDAASRRHELDLLSRLVSTVPVRRLLRPRGRPRALPAAIRADLERLGLSSRASCTA